MNRLASNNQTTQHEEHIWVVPLCTILFYLINLQLPELGTLVTHQVNKISLRQSNESVIHDWWLAFQFCAWQIQEMALLANSVLMEHWDIN